MAMDSVNQDLDMQSGSNDITVAIWMISYNQSAFIRQSIESVLYQLTDFKFRIFISDDCSTDGTDKIIQELATQFPDKIDFVPNAQNIGPFKNAYQTYSRCFQSRAKYIAMLEGDDAWNDPHKLQQQVDHLEAHPEASIVWHNYDCIDQNGNLLDPQPVKGSLRSYTSAELKGITSIKTLTVCYRNLFDEMPPEYFNCPNGDSFLFAMLGRFGSAHYLESIWPAHYRVHTGGIWSEQKTRHRDLLTLQSYAALANYFGKHHEVDAQLYYVDRSVKTQYLLSFEDRSSGQWAKAFAWCFRATRIILAHGKIKTLPHVWMQFIRIVCFGKNVSWALRQTPNSQ